MCPTLAIEVTARAVRALRVGAGWGRPRRCVYAERPLPPGVVVSSPSAPNVRDEAAFGLVLTEALGPRPPRLDEKDPLPQSLGYRHDATKVDRQKFAKYQAGQVCSNCQFYLGRTTEPWRPYQIFTGKLVNATGWCSAYVGKG